MEQAWLNRSLVLACGLLVALGLSTCEASARQRLVFEAGRHTRGSAVSSGRHRGGARMGARRSHGSTQPHVGRRSRGGGGGEGDGGEAVARPGGGFVMQDGVLTYPAPARFQPKNLKRF